MGRVLRQPSLENAASFAPFGASSPETDAPALGGHLPYVSLHHRITQSELAMHQLYLQQRVIQTNLRATCSALPQ